MERGDKREFDFRLTYFKPSGKYYTDTVYRWVCANIGGEKRSTPYMNDIVAHIRGLRDGNGQSALPGLSGMWDGFILVDHPDGVPTLIVPLGVG